MRFDGIIFDFDGTIADTSEGVLSAVEYALAKLGSPPFDRRLLRGFIGPALFVSFQEITGLSAEQAERAIEYYREFYLPKGVYMCSLYDGMTDLFDRLAGGGAKLAIASAKPQPSLDIVTKHLGIDRYFDIIVGSSPSVKTNEKAEYVQKARLGTTTAMVGDSVFDVAAAKSVGVYSIAVTYGFSNREQLLSSAPDKIVSSVSDLSAFLTTETL